MAACLGLQRTAGSWGPSNSTDQTRRPPAHRQQQRRGSQQQRRWRRHAAGGSSGGGDGESVDIDALAARLAAEAQKLRRSGGLSSGDDEAAERPAQPRQPKNLLQPFGYEVRS